MATQIIIFQEKRADRHFVAETGEEMRKVFAKVIRERAAEGYCYHKPVLYSVTAEEEELANITDEQLAILPSSIVDKVTKARRSIGRKHLSFAADTVAYEKIQRIVDAETLEDAANLKTDDGRHYLADVVTRDRNEYQYEGYDYFTPESV